jgi:hypothetical protein
MGFDQGIQVCARSVNARASVQAAVRAELRLQDLAGKVADDITANEALHERTGRNPFRKSDLHRLSRFVLSFIRQPG